MVNQQPISPASHPGIAQVLLVANVCNTAQLTQDDVLGTPTEGALLVAAAKLFRQARKEGRGGGGGGEKETDKE